MTFMKNYMNTSGNMETMNTLIIPLIISFLVKNSLCVIGGKEIDITKYPFMVSVRDTMGLFHRGGGTLVKENWVLSASEYFAAFRPEFITCVMGLSHIYRFSINDAQMSQAERLIPFQPNIDAKEDGNDIGLIKLKRKMKLSKFVGLVKLPPLNSPTPDDFTEVCKIGTIMGWGRTVPVNPDNVTEYYFKHTRNSCKLKEVDVKIINEDAVYNFVGDYYKRLPSQMFFQSALASDACFGDMGGPIMCEGVQVGIISFGLGCANEELPAFNTRIDKFVGWIQDTMGKH